MTRLEIAKVLHEIMRDNNFSIIERDNCHEKYSDKINSMQNIFYLKNSSDFTYLYSISHLLSDKEEAVNDYLLNENKDSNLVKNVKLPTREDLLLVATAFEENLEFFSMAWNWVVISEDRISSIIKELKLCDYTSEKDLSNALEKKIGSQLVVNETDLGTLISFNIQWKDCVSLYFYPESKILLDIKEFTQSESSSSNGIKDSNIGSFSNNIPNNHNILYLFKTDADMFTEQQLDLDYPVYASAAGVPGFNNITRIPIDLLGELEVRGNSETKRLVFVLFTNPNYSTLKFELKIKFEVEGSEFTASIKKDSSDNYTQISSQPIHVNFINGFRIIKLEWNIL